MTAPTPDTPATIEAVAYLDRDGDMWIPSGAPEVLLRLDPDCWVSRDDLTDVVRFYGPLVPLVREDVVAAREAAAYARGRDEGRAEGVARAPGGIWPSAARGVVLDALHRVDHPTLPRLATAALMALTPFYRMALDEAQDDEALRERMASLLRGTADALKGDPGPLAAHDWSDLPRVAAELRGEVAVAEQRGAETALREAALAMAGAAEAWHEDGGSPRLRFAYWEAARVIGAWAEKPSGMKGALRRAERLGAQIPGPLDRYPPSPRAAAVADPGTTHEGDLR